MNEINQTSKHYNYLIIGGGMAGCLYAWQLIKHNKSFLIFDEGKQYTSSKIAAGMFNPISGKRMTVNYKANELLDELQTTFEELEVFLNTKLIRFEPIHQAFGNNKEANDFWSRMESDTFKAFINETDACEPALIAPDGCFEVKRSGWVDTRNFVETFANYLLSQHQLVQQNFDYTKLVQTETGWQYEGNLFDKVLCCEGYQTTNNPHFNWLPFKLCKGQIFLIHCAGLQTEKIIKKGVYLVHLGNGNYKVGATYEWDDIDEICNEKGKNMLIEKLENMLNVPFEVLEQYAGVRPTTRDRKAILGGHPDLPSLFVFNGLGTKGVLQAPYLARQLFDYIENNIALENDFTIERFAKFYSNGQ